MNRLLNFDIDDMSLRHQLGFAEALQTVYDVLSGLQEQPRFSAPDGYNKAGTYLEHLRTYVGFELDHIRKVARTLKPRNSEDAEAKFDILLGEMSGGGERPSFIVAELAKLVSEMDWELQFAGDRKRVAEAPIPATASVLFERWLRERDKANADESGADPSVVFHDTNVAEKLVHAAPAKSLRDLAAKIIAATDHGAYMNLASCEAGRALVEEAARIVGREDHLEGGAS